MTKRKIIFIAITLSLAIGAQWPVGFAQGYQVKNRSLCQQVNNNTKNFRFAAGGIMRGEKADGTFRTQWYVDGLKNGMLFSLKGCYEKSIES
jgi:hypothetical protein